MTPCLRLLVEVAFLTRDSLAARMTHAFQDFADATLINPKGCRNGMLVLALPMAEPHLHRVITRELIGRIFHFRVLKRGPENLTDEHQRVVCACYRYRSAGFPEPLRFDREAGVLANLGFSRSAYMLQARR
ncbi:hypothetical protein D3C87_1535700 [compost metagenome]